MHNLASVSSRGLCIAIGLGLTGIAYADLPYFPSGKAIQFSQPMQYCFSSSEGYAELTRATYTYYLTTAQADHYKDGDIFVGFRLRSQPTTVWLLGKSDIPNDVHSWRVYDAVSPARYLSGSLQPVTRMAILGPTDISSLALDGEVWVGYGLRPQPGATVRDSFQEMLNSNRYSVVWVVGTESGWNHICLKATEMTVTGVAVPN